MPKTIVYLKRPQVTSAFEVSAVLLPGNQARLVGPGLASVARFIRVSEGEPQFDLEYEGRLFSKCRAGGVQTEGSLTFTFESTTIPEPTDSDPDASYR